MASYNNTKMTFTIDVTSEINLHDNKPASASSTSKPPVPSVKQVITAMSL